MIAPKVTVRGDDQVLAELRRIAQRLGPVLAKPEPIHPIVADTILAHMDQECDPDGVPWPALSPAYQAYKDVVSPGSEMGRLFGAMKDPSNLRGGAVVGVDSLLISYGVDPEAIAHAVSFTLGGIVSGTSQPPRPFYGLNRPSEEELTRYFSTIITT